ncbi:eukaryotic translation initiation factor 2A [Nannizzia gypsea CBS 118893]|uniref:Eukaryotic translation initiation factor 2A n=1 Tax=Arthroderma gypseum (strain ATCC MYA-4604 / CBS 118893) TaxID=535722 RepID=E4UWW6_ARTGP|nr:eukaryotic translation initiation factor 2A [Nannizzia gypsea CBS 118893]EFR02605.1 eukaryotic translation initiation factor 2A [Nannizzia gypsea CBS 118893]
MAAPTQLAYRTVKGIGILDAAPVYEPLAGFVRPEGNLRCSAYSACGRYFAWAAPEGVTIVDPSVGHIVNQIPAENVYEVDFSPLGTYVITWQRPSKDANGDAVRNLKVWKVATENEAQDQQIPIGSFVQKSQTGWNLQYASDEQYCARVVTNEVQFYESGNLGTVWKKLRVEGVSDFALSPGKGHAVATFIPERKGQPASVKIFDMPNFNAPVSQKSFYKGDKVQLKWNNTGTTLIVLAQTDVDKSGKSYYGETTLYLLSVSGTFDSRIDLDKEGPIHDVTWSPTSKEFGVVYGYMPAKTTIFNTRAVATHSFQLGPRNTILFSPHGRFVLVAGFGNLAGQMDIYDVEKDYKKIVTIEASNASVCEWSPDGKHILTATTSPRLRVDNGVRIWHVTGALMYNEDMNELYSVAWRPQSPNSHPLTSNPLTPVPSPHPSATAYLSTKKAPTKPAGAYRPPGARGQSTPLAFRREDEGGAAFVREESSAFGSNGGSASPFGKPRRRAVPGAEPVEEFLPPGAAPGGGVALPPGADAGSEKLSKAAAKNKKKREAKKAKEAGAGGQGDNGETYMSTAPGSDRRDRSRSRGHRQQPSGGANGANGTNLDPNHPRNGRDRSRSAHRRQRSDGRTGTPNRNGNANHPHDRRAPAVNVNTASRQQAAPPDLTVTSPDGGNTANAVPDAAAIARDKKMRSLLKKVRAIDELKMRVASGEKLEETQMKKIHTEESVRNELEALGWTG